MVPTVMSFLTWFEKPMEDLQLLDYYRILNPDRKVYNWIKKTHLKQSRLDYILISENLSNLVENILIK